MLKKFSKLDNGEYQFSFQWEYREDEEIYDSESLTDLSDLDPDYVLKITMEVLELLPPMTVAKGDCPTLEDCAKIEIAGLEFEV